MKKKDKDGLKSEYCKLLVRRYIKRYFGKRCKDQDDDCPICQQWKCYDDLFNWDDNIRYREEDRQYELSEQLNRNR